MFQNQPLIHPLHKIDVFEQFTKFTAKYLCWSLFLIKLQFWGPATLLKKIQTQVFPREICKLFKNNYFEEHLWNAASKHYLKRDSKTVAFLWILWIIQEHLFFRGSTNGVRKWLPHSYFSVNFEKCLGNLFCRTPPSNHFSHDMMLFFFPCYRSVRFEPKISLVGGATVN